MNPVTRECNDCPDLQKLLSYIDCTILDLTQSKYNSIVYGVKECVDSDLLKDLENYKRIITARLYNSHYPCYTFSSNELLSKVRLLAYKTNCSRCPECEEVTTTTTTLPPPAPSCYSYLVSAEVQTGMSEQYPYSYINCDGDVVIGTISQYQALNICAVRNSVVIDTSVFTIMEYSNTCEVVPETCTCSEITNEETDPGVEAYVFSYSDCDGNDYVDVPLLEQTSTFICVKPSTLVTNFNFSLTIGDPCTDACSP